jgi:hypothetical protein
MALDLFVNFERYSNSSLFYRVTSSSPSTFTVKLSDLSTPDSDLSVAFFAQSALNGGDFADFNFNGSATFDTSSPCVCSISVSVSTIENVLFSTFSVSGVFVDSLLSSDFVAYPNNYINESTGQLVALNSTNYYTSPGVYFYGEGHTEIINLSASTITNGSSANWFIGNPIDNILNNTSYLSTVIISPSTAFVSIPSIESDESEYPISLLVTNSSITSAGPIVTYDDVTGEVGYYPFFKSSLISTPTNTKDSITVRQYPQPVPSLLDSPFALSSINLPLDYSLQTFRGVLSSNSPGLTSILAESFVGSQWELQTIHDAGAFDLERSTQTIFLSNINIYQFQLGYDQPPEELVEPYFISPSVPSTVSLLVSSFKDVYIDLTPYDWLPKRVYSELSATTVIVPLPFAELYIPNYFNIKGESVSITVVSVPASPFEIKTLTIQSPYSSDILILSGTPLLSGTTGTMQFNKVGVVDLSATAVLRNTDSGVEEEVVRVFSDMIEVVTTYDDVNADYFQSSLTPLKLTYGYQPRLTPNEWAIADNVNSIIEKLYTTIDDLDDYTKLYEKKDKFYGWIGPKKNQISGNASIPTFVWQDIECPQSTEDITTWAEFECTVETTTPSFTWEYHECEGTQSDPTCLQKYCLEWKWKSRKSGVSDVNVTWKSAKCSGEFAKKWLFEKCDIDSDPLNCDRDSWKISTIDTESFPIPTSSSTSRCTIVDAEVNSQTDQIVIAFPTEINLIDKDYFTTYVARRGTADDLFSFQNIVGLTINSEGKVLVLDDTLPRVSVFNITDNKFNLFSTWGGYGLASNPQGFNKPQDIHIDPNNSVWITDTGNNCVKKLTIIGKHLMTITHEKLNASAPLSVCVDSKSNVHCLTETGVIVFDEFGNYSFEYTLPSDVTGVNKINTSYNREMVYITYTNGVIKYFRNGVISHYTVQDLLCSDKSILQGYNSLSQDRFRNVYITVGDKILKIPDLQKIVESKAALPANLYWSLGDLLVHKEEYIQPWVYLKSFHRLWDNIELLRNSLFYSLTGCKAYVKPTYSKADLVIGQNEIVSNAVINRLSEQLWTNLQSLIKYFDPNCEN